MASNQAPQSQLAGTDLPALPPALLQELARALHSIRFGSIELVVHDGRVVQLESREKVRLQIDVTQQQSTAELGLVTELNAPHGRPDYRKPHTSSK